MRAVFPRHGCSKTALQMWEDKNRAVPESAATALQVFAYCAHQDAFGVWTPSERQRVPTPLRPGYFITLRCGFHQPIVAHTAIVEQTCCVAGSRTNGVPAVFEVRRVGKCLAGLSCTRGDAVGACAKPSVCQCIGRRQTADWRQMRKIALRDYHMKHPDWSLYQPLRSRAEMKKSGLWYLPR